MKRTTQALDRLVKALKGVRGVRDISTTAPKAPWNTTGRRLWHATVRGKEFTAFTPAALIRQLKD